VRARVAIAVVAVLIAAALITFAWLTADEAARAENLPTL
jgi:hypothetical protein